MRETVFFVLQFSFSFIAGHKTILSNKCKFIHPFQPIFIHTAVMFYWLRNNKKKIFPHSIKKTLLPDFSVFFYICFFLALEIKFRLIVIKMARQITYNAAPRGLDEVNKYVKKNYFILIKWKKKKQKLHLVIGTYFLQHDVYRCS